MKKLFKIDMPGSRTIGLFLVMNLAFLSFATAQTFGTSDQTAFEVIPGQSPGSIIYSPSASGACGAYSIRLKALNEVNGKKFDEWFVVPGDGAIKDGEIVISGGAISGFECKMDLPVAPILANFPSLITGGSNNCSSDTKDCAGTNLSYSKGCDACQTKIGASKSVGGYTVCATLEGPGITTPNASQKRIFFFCFEREIEPQIDASFNNLTHSDCSTPFVDGIAFDPNNPKTSTMSNSIYFRIINGSGDYELVDCGTTVPPEVKPIQIGAAVGTEKYAYWKVELDKTSLNPNTEYTFSFCFCLKEKGSNKKVKDTTDGDEQICGSICYKSGGGPKKADDVIFVVDKSGSMGWDIDPNNANSLTRYDGVKIVFSSILDGWKGIDPQDQIGLVWFNQGETQHSVGNSTVFQINNTALYSPEVTSCFDLPRWPINSAVCNVTPGGSTSLGAGMQRAVNMLENEPSAHRKHIILLTDGEQNTAPFVTIQKHLDFTGSAFGFFGFMNANEDVYAYHGPDPLMIRKIGGGSYTFGKPGTQVHVGAFGQNQGAAYGQFLYKLAGDTGGKTEFFSGAKNDITTAGEQFALELHNLFGETVASESPRKVFTQARSATGGKAIDEFSIAGEYTLLQVTAGNVADNNIKIEKVEVQNNNGAWIDLVPLTSGVEMRPASNIVAPYRIFTVDFNQVQGVSPGSRMRITTNSAKSSFNYFLKVIVDDLSIKFRNSVERNRIVAGEPIPLKVNIFQKDDTQPNGYKGITPDLGGRARAIIRRPQKSYSRIFAEANMPRKYVECDCGGVSQSDFVIDPTGKEGVAKAAITRQVVQVRRLRSSKLFCDYVLTDEALNIDNESGNNYLEKKLKILESEKDYYEKLTTVEEVVELTHRGSGVYTALYDTTQNSGDYQIEFLIDGPGSFARRASETTVVGFAKPVFETSQVRLQSENTLVLGFKPRDIYKNYLGANRTRSLSVNLEEGTAGPLKDYMNGRYVTVLQGKGVRYNNDINIRVLNQDLYRGKLWKLLHRNTLSAQAGVAFPTSDFGDDFQRDYFVEGKFGIRLISGLFVQFGGSHYEFRNKADFSELKVTGGGIGLQYNFPIVPGSGWNLYIEGQGGYYDPDLRDAAIGYGAALGITKTIRANWAFVIEGQYRHIDTDPDPISFGAVSVGLRHSFSGLFPRNKIPCKCTNCTFFLIPSCIVGQYGRIYPTGNTQNDYGEGSVLELGLKYPVASDFYFMVEGGRYDLPGKSGVSDVSINKLGLGFYSNFNLGKIGNLNKKPDLVFGGGAGYYWPDNLDKGFGLKALAGFHIPFATTDTRQFKLMLNGSYNRLFNQSDDVEFWGVTGGVSWCF